MRRWPAILFALAAACGGGSSAVCGDGVREGDEQCDDGNDRDDDACSNECRARDTLDATVIWLPLFENVVPGFQETCGGVEASQIEIVIEGPISVTERIDCSLAQYPFRALRPGDYTVRGTLYDAGGTAVTRGMAAAGFSIGATDVMVRLHFPWDDFLRTYQGNYFFRIRWGGADMCAAASPPVLQHVLRLERGGQPLPGMTNNGDPIDGSAPGMCRDASDEFPQTINGLVWGPATFTIEGRDASGQARFRETFDTFIGAGLSNPEINFDVDSLDPDAGPPDAGPVDAAPPDAM